jgi:hypothetical protein
MPALATIDGIPILTITPVSWSLVAGTRPYQTVVAVAKKAVKGDPSDLVGKRTSLVVAGEKDGFTASCYILGVTQGAHPAVLMFTIADKRWLWPRTHILRRYNCRRKTGDRRLLTEGVSERIAITVDDYYYEVATLYKHASLWTIKDALTEILKAIEDGEPDTSGVKFREIPFENVELDDPGDAAIDHVRALSTGINVYVTLDGTTKLLDETDLDSATKELKKFGDPVVGKGIAATTVRAGVRPAYVDVLFSVEQELKFLNVEEGGGYYAVPAASKKERYIENVIQVPDLGLYVGGRWVTKGTWITVDEAFTAWNAARKFTSPNPMIQTGLFPWSHATIQKLWFSNLEEIFTNIGLVSTQSNDEADRLAAIRQCYRTCYRISPYWMNRIKNLIPSRVAIVDTENGVRAPGMIFADYAVSPGMRAVFGNADNAGWWRNVTDAFSETLSDCKYCPAVLTVEDEQLGIVRFNFATGTQHMWNSVLPCALDDPPTADYRKGKTAPIFTGGAVYGTTSASTALATGHRCGFVLTATPSAPNNNDQLHRVRIFASDVGSMGIEATPATGPGMEVRVGIGATAASVARFAWSDNYAKSIDAMFGVSDPGTGGRPKYAGTAALAEAGLLVGADETNQIAKSIAAAVYSSLTDRVVGTQSMRLGKATLKPTGNLVEVVFSVDGQGAMNTSGNFNPTAGRVDVTSLLSSDVRRKLLRLAQP